MPILNFTTSIEAAKTVGEIQAILGKHGARSITTDYDDNGKKREWRCVRDHD